jgi:hypothetical protein
MPHDYMRTTVLNEINRQKTTNTKYGEELHKAVPKVTCFTCMDSKKLWDYRETAFSSWDMKGSYDIVNCNGCVGGGYIKPVHSVTGYYQRDKVNDQIGDRVKELYSKYLEIARNEEQQKELLLIEQHNTMELNVTPLWKHGASDTLTEVSKSVDIHIAVGKLADKILSAIKLANGNLLELANFAKNVTLTINFQNISSENIHKEALCGPQDRWGNSTYIILEYSKKEYTTKKKSLLMTYNTSMSDLSVKYKILTPQNKAARDNCNKTLNKFITSIKLDV